MALNISAKEVNELRQKTGSGMMDCKKALVQAEGDFNKAIDILRKKGQKVSEARSNRETSEGIVIYKLNSSEDKASILSFTCETDFVAKNEEFKDLASKILDLAFDNSLNSVGDILKKDLYSNTVEQHIVNLIGKIGEKIEITEYKTLEGGKIVPYIHAGNKLGVLVSLSNVSSVDYISVGKDVAMQIAAMNPIAINSDQVDQSVIDKEIEIGKDQARKEGKTEQIIDRAFDSKGGDIRDEDLKIISVLSEVTISEIKTRDHLEKYVKKEMNTLAPNISSIAGENIGARLIAKAGSLEKLARLPSSTIQILGAEKALFRALKTASKPPKHGILFQHDDIHAAPKWQRCKIARSLASKIAIAARVDAYRGVKMDGSIETSLKNRIDEIKKLKKPKFKKQSQSDSFVSNRSSRGSLRDDKPRYKQYSKYGKIKRRSQSVHKSDRRSKYEKSSANTKDLRRSKAHNKSKRRSKSGRKTQS